jgi:hypothetical protein
MIMTADLQPDIDEVLQVESPAGAEPTVKVEVTNPVRVQRLPRKAASTKTRTVDTNIVQLLGADPRRASFTLVASAAVLLAFTETSAQDAGTSAQWPANVPYTSDAGTELWVKAQTGTAAVSVISQYWATGD